MSCMQLSIRLFHPFHVTIRTLGSAWLNVAYVRHKARFGQMVTTRQEEWEVRLSRTDGICRNALIRPLLHNSFCSRITR